MMTRRFGAQASRSRAATVAVVAVAQLVSACRGRDARAPDGGARGNATSVSDARNVDAGASFVLRPEAVRGAIPAWQAVIDRAVYLERRGGSGVVRGVVGSVDASLVWLVDDTEGGGSLAIRVLLPPPATVGQGNRIAVAGAWALDPSRDWIWRGKAWAELPAASPSKSADANAPAAPGCAGLPADQCGSGARPSSVEPVDAARGHAIVDGELPPNARPISIAKQTEVAYFAVVGSPPPVDGDGWLVADTPTSRPYALINMPGERPSFGGQDYRTAAERWSLQRGETYWVRIGPVRRRPADKLATVTARTAPIHVPRSATRTDR